MLPQGALGRIGLNAINALFSRGLAIAQQLLLTPLFIGAWGAELYGEWLGLVAFPILITWADFGLTTALSNRISELATQERIQEGAQVATTGLLLLFALLLTLFAIGGYAANSKLILLPITLLSSSHAWLIVSLYALATAFSLISNVFIAILRAADRLHSAMSIANIFFFLEIIVIAAALISEARPLQVACISPVAKFAQLLVTAVTACLYNPQLLPHRSGFRSVIIAEILLPSLGFGFLTGSQLLYSGGMIVVASYTLPSAEVASFSLLRALTRVPLQIAGIINLSVWPELTKLYARGEFKTIDILISRGMKWGVLISFLLYLFLYATIPFLFHVLGKGQLTYSSFVLLLLIASAIMRFAAETMAMPLVAANQTASYSVISLFVTLAFLGLASTGTGELGSLWIATCLLLIDFCTLLVIIRSRNNRNSEHIVT